jgi:predicted nucleic acid-binding Zn ribbon protein
VRLGKDTTIRIGDLLKKTLQSAGLAERVDRQTAVAFWAEIVGPKLAEKTRALRVENDVLKVKVSSAPWRNEMVFFKEDILKKIAEKIGPNKINDIIFY